MNTTTTAAAVLALLNIPSLDCMPEAVKTAAETEKAAAAAVKTAAAAAEKHAAAVDIALDGGDIAAAQKARKAQKAAVAELEKAKATQKAAVAELEKAKEANPYKQPTVAEYCVAAAADLLRNGVELSAKAVATVANTLRGDNATTPNGTEMTARGVIAALSCIKVDTK